MTSFSAKGIKNVEAKRTLLRRGTDIHNDIPTKKKPNALMNTRFGAVEQSKSEPVF